MNESDKSVLKKYHQQLADDIIVDEELLAGLFTEGVFEKGMIATIRARSPEKIQKLLELLPKRGPAALTKFIQVIEPTNPWLATSLTNARGQPTEQAKSPKKGNANNKHPSSTVSGSVTLRIDGDIKQIVSTFIHKQFGQSRKISEVEKKNILRFISEQIQLERNRYQPLLRQPSDLGHNDDIFTGDEVRQQLYSIHTKLDPVVTQERRDLDLSQDCTDESDDDGHPGPDHRRQRPDRRDPKPDDIDINLVHKEIDTVLCLIDNLNKRIEASLRYFKPSDRADYPLDQLVGKVVNRCKDLEEEMADQRDQVGSLLDENHRHFDKIARLKTECGEFRRQNQVLCEDMGSKIGKLNDSLAKSKQREQQLQRQLDNRNNAQQGTSRNPLRASTSIRGQGGGGGVGGGRVTQPSVPNPNRLALPGAATPNPRSARSNASRPTTTSVYQGNNYPSSTYEGGGTSPRGYNTNGTTNRSK